MVENNLYCDTHSRIFTKRCGLLGSWWAEAPEPYCQYSCWENDAGYEDFPCCPIEDLSSYVPPPAVKEPGCVECSNYRTDEMIANNQYCDSAWNLALNTQCGNPGSEWDTLEDPPCQYECWRWGKPYTNFQNCCEKDPEPHFGIEPCVQCTNTRTQGMIENDRYCDRDIVIKGRCANPGSWWADVPDPYCQYTCWENGVGYEGYKCCPIDDLDAYVPPPVEKQPGCVECSSHRTQFMIDNGRMCDSWDYVLETQCNNEGSYWNTLADPPCQYECWLGGKAYDNYQNCCERDPEPHFGLSTKAGVDPDAVTTTPPRTAPPTVSPAPTLPPGKCVQCSNIRPMNMILNDLYCDTYSWIFKSRCNNERSWWKDAPEPYCQYSCWANGVGYDDYPCCPIDDVSTYVPPPVEKEPGCIECTNDRTEFMIEGNRMCDSWDFVLQGQCNNEGSFWNTLEDPPCQYECWLWNKPYDKFQNCCKKDYEPHFGLESRAI